MPPLSGICAREVLVTAIGAPLARFPSPPGWWAVECNQFWTEIKIGEGRRNTLREEDGGDPSARVCAFLGVPGQRETEVRIDVFGECQICTLTNWTPGSFARAG